MSLQPQRTYYPVICFSGNCRYKLCWTEFNAKWVQSSFMQSVCCSVPTVWGIDNSPSLIIICFNVMYFQCIYSSELALPSMLTMTASIIPMQSIVFVKASVQRVFLFLSVSSRTMPGDQYLCLSDFAPSAATFCICFWFNWFLCWNKRLRLLQHSTQCLPLFN